ncbi:alkaline phosphatase [Halobacillus sp. BAB-2008]|nr:alkaline phosphatase [Halobacillus sp. BAB-2008]
MGNKQVHKWMMAAAVSAMVFGSSANYINAEEQKVEKPKNIIMMIGDGMGTSYTTAHRYMKDNPETMEVESNLFDPYLVGMHDVSSLDKYYDGGAEDEKESITDSAAAGTAMSSGVKTYHGAIGVDLEHKETKTVLEEAKELGKSTGLVATAQINHATPAAYAAHNVSRENYNEIADDYYDEKINGEHKVDVLLGGGTDFFAREDRNLTEEFKKDGYDYVTTADELAAADGEQLLGLFAPVGLDYAIDRPKEQPSLAEMTTKALDTLGKNDEGFFLMVEGSQVDWAGHDNDIVAAMSEVEDFEQAHKKAIEFAQKDGETLVITTADHSTGGMTVGAGGPYNWDAEPVKAAKHTPDYMARQIVEDGADVEKTLQENIGFDVTEEEIASVEKAIESASGDDRVMEVDNSIEAIFNERSGTGWTTDGHTGEDIPVYAYGPGADLFTGQIDNTDHAKNIFQLMDKSSEAEEGGELADTSAAYPAGIVLGAVIAGAGGILLFRRRQMNKA